MLPNGIAVIIVKHGLHATAPINPKTNEKHKRNARKEDYDKPSQSGK